MGDTSGTSAIFDALTGGAAGLAVSIGKSFFGESDDDKILELEQLQDEQRARIITATTLPDNEFYMIELLEYVYTQIKAKQGEWGYERKAWKSLHLLVYNRARMIVEGDSSLTQYVENLKPAKKSDYSNRHETVS